MEEYIKTQFSEEDILVGKGFSTVVGIDEAGRGSLAGPVVAAAVFISDRSSLKELSFGDSKSIGEKRREELFNIFSLSSEIKWGTGSVSSKVVDRINVLKATKLAMRRALLDLKRKGVTADALLIDGNFLLGTALQEKAVIRGDETIASCKIAGIIAKVIRDKTMRRNSKRYPGYCFERHKGYGTVFHLKAIEKLGHCPIHRTTFVVKKLRDGFREKRFQKRIEDFICEKCDSKVKGRGYTDHCPQCLWSKHVDLNPGDRKSKCSGLMEPIGVEVKSDQYILYYCCTKCGFKHRVKSATDDNFDEIIKITNRPFKK